MTFSPHPGVEHDIANALDFYSKQAGLVVAERFLEEFERVAKLLAEHPGLGTPTTRGRRTFPLKIYPKWFIRRTYHVEAMGCRSGFNPTCRAEARPTFQ